MINRYQIKIGNSEYDYFLVSEIYEIKVKLINIEADCFFVLSDNKINDKTISTIQTIFEENSACKIIKLDINEKNKDLNTAVNVIENLLDLGVSKSSCIVAIGGGGLCNIVGFIASLLYRGIKLIYFPTNVLASIDCSISLKQSVNSVKKKSPVGTFYAPSCVVASYDLFDTISNEDFNSGLVELVVGLLTIIPEEIDCFLKVIRGGRLNYEDYNKILNLAIKSKTSVLLSDPHERNDAMLLKYGHTIGNFLEFSCNGAMRHGEAVAFGMLVSAEISNILGFLSNDDMLFHYQLLDKINVLKQIASFFKYLDGDIVKKISTSTTLNNISISQNTISLILMDSIGKNHKEQDSYYTIVPLDIVNKGIENVKNRIKEYVYVED